MDVASVTSPIGLWTAVLKPRVCLLVVAILVVTIFGQKGGAREDAGAKSLSLWFQWCCAKLNAKEEKSTIFNTSEVSHPASINADMYGRTEHLQTFL